MFFKKNKIKESPNKYESFDKYWLQSIEFSRVDNRIEYFKNICKNKKVLHIGCTDWPIFDPQSNLHIHLNEVAKEISGFDTDKEGLKNLSKYVSGNYYSEFSQIGNEAFDLCLVPETIEHVDNIKDFIVNLETINAETFYITAPNCFSTENIERNYQGTKTFIEVVHPDHNCWFSPYTLKNIIQKYTAFKVNEVYLMEQDRMICCVASKTI